jgi:hypothetical protein
MNRQTLKWTLRLTLLAGLLPNFASGQVSPERLAAIGSRLQQAKAFFQKMPERDRRRLSGAALISFNWQSPGTGSSPT